MTIAYSDSESNNHERVKMDGPFKDKKTRDKWQIGGAKKSAKNAKRLKRRKATMTKPPFK